MFKSRFLCPAWTLLTAKGLSLCLVLLSMLSPDATFAQTTHSAIGAEWNARDKQFVLDVALNNLTEIKLGEIARERATSPSIKAFAEKMAAGHCQAGTAMRALAASHNLIIPSKLDDAHQVLVDTLAKAPENRFDQLYLRTVIEAHKKMIATLNRQSDTADSDLKNWLTDTLPTFRSNLKIVQGLQAKLPRGQ